MRHIRLGKLFGIEVDLHYSWFLILAILALTLGRDFYPTFFPELSIVETWTISVIASILLFISVLLHEISHSLIAKVNNLPVERITLFFFGGMASIKEKHMTPWKEFSMAIAGPMFSIVLGLVFWGVLVLSKNVYANAISFYLFRINLLLAGFNLMPGYPLDGGRAFRAVLWYFSDDLKKSTRIAASWGKYFGYFLAFVGIIGIVGGNFSALWFVFLGLFLVFLAGVGYQQVILKDILTQVTAGDIMKKDFLRENASITLAKAIDKHVLTYRQEDIGVLEKKKVVGFVPYAKLAKLSSEALKNKTLKDVAIPMKRFKKCTPKTSLYTVFEEMMRRGTKIMPIQKEQNMVGVVRVEDIVKILQRSNLQ